MKKISNIKCAGISATSGIRMVLEQLRKVNV